MEAHGFWRIVFFMLCLRPNQIESTKILSIFSSCVFNTYLWRIWWMSFCITKVSTFLARARKVLYGLQKSRDLLACKIAEFRWIATLSIENWTPKILTVGTDRKPLGSEPELKISVFCWFRYRLVTDEKVLIVLKRYWRLLILIQHVMSSA